MIKSLAALFISLLTLAAVAPASAQMVLHRGNGAEPDTLDPHLATGNWENQIIGDMIVGLFTEDGDGNAIYGAAESHTVSEDGLTWTFKIRDHVWSDGTPVTAGDFVFAWQRILDPKTGSQYASLITGEFKNGLAISEGNAPPESLGARAIDDKTLELKLEHPAPYLPELLTHYTTFPVPRHTVLTYGKDWIKAGTYVGNGAYTLVTWEPNNFVRLKKNPAFYDAANVKVDEVNFYPLSDTSAALKRFRAGELDIQNGLSSQDIDWIKENMPDSLYLDPYAAISYIAINQSRPPLNDVRLREALSLAFDRDTVAHKLLKFQEQPAYALIPPGIAGYPGGNFFSFKDMGYEQRVARAKELMEQAGYGPGKPLKISFITGSAPDNKRVSAAIQQMWKEIWVEIEIRQLETKTVYDLMQTQNFDVGQAAWIADYDDAKNFLYLFRTDANAMNYGKYQNAEFDRLMQESDQMKDVTERGKLLAQAEKLLLDEYGFISNRFLNVRHVVQPWVKGFKSNVSDVNRTRWLSVERPSGPAAQTGVQPEGTGAGAVQEQGWWEWFLSLLCSWFGISCPANT